MTESPKIPKGWKQYPPCAVLHPGSSCIYQKKIGEVYIEIIAWRCSETYELGIQIPSELSITGRTINITNFNYEKLNFAGIEKDGKKLIKALTK